MQLIVEFFATYNYFDLVKRKFCVLPEFSQKTSLIHMSVIISQIPPMSQRPHWLDSKLGGMSSPSLIDYL